MNWTQCPKCKRRTCTPSTHECEKPRAELERENARLREALEKIERHGPIMGSTGDYRQGQLDILEAVSTIAGLALVSVPNKANMASGPM